MKMDKRPLRKMMTTSAAVFLHFLLIFFSINTSPTRQQLKVRLIVLTFKHRILYNTNVL